MPVLDQDDSCPHCGYALPANASRCRQCGASAEYGWDSVDGDIDDFEPDSLEDDFDYDEFVAREFPEHAEGHAKTGQGLSMASRWVVLALLVSLILTFVLW